MPKLKQTSRISPPTKKMVEKKLKLVEVELARLQAETGKPIGVLPYGLDAICGSFAGDADFLEAMRLGAEWRASFRPKARKKSGRKRS